MGSPSGGAERRWGNNYKNARPDRRTKTERTLGSAVDVRIVQELKPVEARQASPEDRERLAALKSKKDIQSPFAPR